MNITFTRSLISRYLCIYLFFLASSISFANDQTNEVLIGWGFEAGISNQGFQAGPLYRFKNVSFALNMRGLTGTYADSPISSFITDFRTAMNIELSSLYFFQIGIDWQQIWAAKQTASNTNGSTELGPIIGVQRFFPNSTFFLLAYIIPYQYNYFNETVTEATGTQHQFLANGALMFGLLF